MPSFRVERTSEDVLRELTAIIREMKDPRIQGALLSVVKVDLARDLSSCKVYVSSMKNHEAAIEAVKCLKLAAGFIRHELSLKVDLRHTPELRFIADDSIEYSAGISKLLNQLGEHSDEN